MRKSLAIVIPAFKGDFFRPCLQSITAQSNKDFKLYIGIDGSPDDLELLIDPFTKNINIIYKRFEENVGQTSLVKHWERCIQMTSEEEWIWLFGDDDTMDVDCVAGFFKTLESNPLSNIFRFNLDVINSAGFIRRTTVYPEKEDSESFLLNRFSLKYDSAITNHIFRKQVYEETGFQDFPLAWCTDDATVAAFSRDQQIVTIPKAKIQWRISDINLSSTGNNHIQKKKVHSRLKYVQWLYGGRQFPAFYKKKNKALVVKWMINSIENEFSGFSGTEKRILFKETGKVVRTNMAYHRSKLFLLRSYYRLMVSLSLIKSSFRRKTA